MGSVTLKCVELFYSDFGKCNALQPISVTFLITLSIKLKSVTLKCNYITVTFENIVHYSSITIMFLKAQVGQVIYNQINLPFIIKFLSTHNLQRP